MNKCKKKTLQVGSLNMCPQKNKMPDEALKEK